MKKLKLTQKYFAAFILPLLFTAAAYAADDPSANWRVMVSPESSLSFQFMRGAELVFSASVGAAGPNWSRPELKSNEKATGDELVLTTPCVFDKANGQVITIKQRVWKSGERDISFQYDLSSDKDIPLIELGAGKIVFEPKFQDGDILFKHTNGSEGKLPLAIGGPGGQPETGTLVFRSKTAGDITATIDPPLPVAYHGKLKFQMAKDLFKAGTKTVTVTYHLPGPTSLLVKQADVDKLMLSMEVPEKDLAFHPDDAHPFAPGTDDPSKCQIDLRYLNEKEAGQSGFLKRGPTGDQFLLGDGTPVRFWAVCSKDEKQLDQHARWLARMGVNMVRVSGATLQPRAPGSKVTDVEEDSLQKLWHAVAILKKQGIYTTIHPYWGHGQGADLTNWGIEGYTGKDMPWGLLFFNKELQRGYRTWLKELFTRPNPYTGIPLAKDPAVGIFILQNEDSLLFWTSQGIKPQQKAVLAAQFVEWLKVKYGSLDAAVNAWDGDKLPNDRVADGVLGIYDISAATAPKTGGKEKRITDQYQFFVETMRRFNAETVEYLRKDLGCKMLICAGNWRPASEELMLDAERWSYTTTDVVAKNHYFNGVHQGGGAAGSAVNNGDIIADRSVLFYPWMFPVNMKQIAGFPNMITESTWTNPDLYQSEAAFLVAAYGSLTGLNAFYWYATSATEYAPMSSWNFDVSAPMLAGMFPAAALIYRKGYVQPSKPVIHEERALADMWARKKTAITEGLAFDPNRDNERREAKTSDNKADQLAFLTGRVEVRPDGDPSKTLIADCSKWIDPKEKILRSSTDELVWNYGTGLCTVNSPKAQGASGFLKQAGPIKLADVQIDSADMYATVLAVPLDDKPLKQSKKVLIQVGTTARPTGWKT